MRQAGIPGEFGKFSRAVPPMPRAKVGVGRRPKKRRVSPASTIEVEQIEEEGVEELVVAEEKKEEEPPGVVVAPSSSVIVAWCVEWVVVETLNMLDYQRDRFARYATLHVAARRANAIEGTLEFGCPSTWASEHTFGELIDAGCPIPGCDGFWEWPRMRCGTCGECLHTCYCERECECGEVAKWSFSENGGVCVCPRPLPVSRELEKIFGT